MANRSRGPKKIGWTHWTGFTGGALALTAGSIAVNLAAAQHTPETLLRTRGVLTAWIDGTVAPGIAAICSVGMCVVPEGTGTTVLWDPFGDDDAPWFYYTEFQLVYEEMVTDVVALTEIASYREVIDSKAMRKVRNSEIQLVITNTTFGSALGMNVQLNGRFLAGHA